MARHRLPRGASASGQQHGEVNEILTFPLLTLCPARGPWLLGVANIRGNLVPVIDLKGFIEGERSQLTDTTRVLLVRQQGGSTVGLLVDEVLGQRNFTDEQRTVANAEEGTRHARYAGYLPARRRAGACSAWWRWRVRRSSRRRRHKPRAAGGRGGSGKQFR